MVLAIIWIKILANWIISKSLIDASLPTCCMQYNFICIKDAFMEQCTKLFANITFICEILCVTISWRTCKVTFTQANILPLLTQRLQMHCNLQWLRILMIQLTSIRKDFCGSVPLGWIDSIWCNRLTTNFQCYIIPVRTFLY